MAKPPLRPHKPEVDLAPGPAVEPEMDLAPEPAVGLLSEPPHYQTNKFTTVTAVTAGVNCEQLCIWALSKCAARCLGIADINFNKV